ncbi:KOW domain-containing RNA-binding protein [Peptoniphilus sp. EMRHCC_23]|uniref:KOW domain-containing RNA-binding protein n=1 Tax=Peptoniphilus TaxID=162289 RepID=UPI001C0085C2|nr:KOW domain-containing RNA-binding protein [Peptoniphilus rachelemmaiella]
MNTTADIKVGQVVISKAGRDKEGFFVVLEVIDDRYLLLADGKRRTLDNPKRKKAMHLQKTHSLVDLKPEDRPLNDSYIRKQLSRFQEA